MVNSRAQPDPGRQPDPVLLRKVLLLPGLAYPFWHLLAPRPAVDPWSAWWLIGGSLVLAVLLSRWSAIVNRHLWGLFTLFCWLATAQLYLLAFLNDMHPFYAVGSAMAVVTVSLAQRTKPAMAAYVALVVVLSVTLFALAPEAAKAAYWGGTLPVLAFAYYRVAVQTKAAGLLLEQRRNLETMVEQRTAELSETNARLVREMEEKERLEEELRFSQKMDAVGRLAGAIAHDFNNLLSTIGVYAALLLEALPSDSPLRRDIEQIEKTNHQAAALTQQLLTFSRRSEAQTEVLDLNAVIENASTMLRHLLSEDAELVIRLGEKDACVRANRDQLEQILINLALNARDAMPAGGTLTIETSVLRREE